MFEQGLEKEARTSFKKGYYQYPALRTIGYQEFLPYFEKVPQYTINDVKDAIVKNTMRYIKRQKTWFRRNPNAIWVKSLEEILAYDL
jgi:tRNA dimethylallyltransferase